VLVNLLSNAVKFTPSGSVGVTLEASRNGDQRCELHFAVQDTGIGIPAARLERLFKPFSQVDSSVTRRYGGSGLGLAICGRLARLLGGRVWAESVEGRGSTFHFTVVAEESAEAPVAAVPPPVILPVVPAPRPLDILLVEDNVVNRQVALSMLERLGYRADSVGDGLEALEAFEGRDYDVILMDLQMPRMDGLEATRRIRLRRDRPQPVIIAVTAHAMLGDRERCLAAGMDDYLSKPIQIEYLQAALHRLSALEPDVDAAPQVAAGCS
jgi:CheY-like chemotaxis protein